MYPGGSNSKADKIIILKLCLCNSNTTCLDVKSATKLITICAVMETLVKLISKKNKPLSFFSLICVHCRRNTGGSQMPRFFSTRTEKVPDITDLTWKKKKKGKEKRRKDKKSKWGCGNFRGEHGTYFLFLYLFLFSSLPGHFNPAATDGTKWGAGAGYNPWQVIRVWAGEERLQGPARMAEVGYWLHTRRFLI